MEKFTKVKNIGKGNMGACALARNNEDGRYYVIKQVDLAKLNKKERQQSLNEAKVLSSLRHPNVINYFDSFLARKSDHLCIVMEFADGGDLSNRIKNNHGINFTETQILDWFIQIALSLHYIHQRKILHRDVKTQNIFLTQENICKLGDFGIARTLNNTYDQASTFVGTPYYLSPELILERPYDHMSDVWALGVVLYELMALRHPFNANDMKSLMHRILKVQYDAPPTMYSADLRNMISRILVKDPMQRIRLGEILELPFVVRRVRQWIDGGVLPTRYITTLIRSKLLPAHLMAYAMQSGNNNNGGSTTSPVGGAPPSGMPSVGNHGGGGGYELAQQQQQQQQQQRNVVNDSNDYVGGGGGGGGGMYAVPSAPSMAPLNRSPVPTDKVSYDRGGLYAPPPQNQQPPPQQRQMGYGNRQQQQYDDDPPQHQQQQIAPSSRYAQVPAVPMEDAVPYQRKLSVQQSEQPQPDYHVYRSAAMAAGPQGMQQQQQQPYRGPMAELPSPMALRQQNALPPLSSAVGMNVNNAGGVYRAYQAQQDYVAPRSLAPVVVHNNPPISGMLPPAPLRPANMGPAYGVAAAMQGYRGGAPQAQQIQQHNNDIQAMLQRAALERAQRQKMFR